jgi:hypothetical protein
VDWGIGGISGCEFHAGPGPRPPWRARAPAYHLESRPNPDSPQPPPTATPTDHHPGPLDVGGDGHIGVRHDGVQGDVWGAEGLGFRNQRIYGLGSKGSGGSAEIRAWGFVEYRTGAPPHAPPPAPTVEVAAERLLHLDRRLLHACRGRGAGGREGARGVGAGAAAWRFGRAKGLPSPRPAPVPGQPQPPAPRRPSPAATSSATPRPGPADLAPVGVGGPNSHCLQPPPRAHEPLNPQNPPNPEPLNPGSHR